MDYNKTIQMLENKMAQLQTEVAKYNDYVRMPRKLYYTVLRKQKRITEQCTAIKAATEILKGKKWFDMNIYEIVLLSVNDRREEKQEMLDFALYEGLYYKETALRFALDISLPICKKRVFDAIIMQSKVYHREQHLNRCG